MMRLTAAALAALVLAGCASFSRDGGFGSVEQLTNERIGQSPTYQRTAEQGDAAKSRVTDMAAPTGQSRGRTKFSRTSNAAGRAPGSRSMTTPRTGRLSICSTSFRPIPCMGSASRTCMKPFCSACGKSSALSSRRVPNARGFVRVGRSGTEPNTEEPGVEDIPPPPGNEASGRAGAASYLDTAGVGRFMRGAGRASLRFATHAQACRAR